MSGPFGCMGCRCFTVSGGIKSTRISTVVKCWEPHKRVTATLSEKTKLIQVASSGQKYSIVKSRWSQSTYIRRLDKYMTEILRKSRKIPVSI